MSRSGAALLPLLLILTVTPGLSQTASPATGSSDSFSVNVAHVLLQQIRDGLVSHNERKMLSVFDAERMTGYLNFRRQIDALFDTYDSFRVHFTIEQSSGDSDRGSATVDFEIEENPASSGGQPVRKHEDLRFTFDHAKTGWKILDVDPRNFFS